MIVIFKRSRNHSKEKCKEQESNRKKELGWMYELDRDDE